MLAAILAKRRKLAPRTLIGVAEVAAIDDLQNAGHAIAALRAMGYRVGLDEFGAGAASVGFLQALPVDFVSFDGALIQKIGSAKREDGLLAGLAKLCGEMGITTIAAGIENEAMAKSVRAMGFHQGQGKWLGAPMKEIPAAPMAVGKRQGVKESWSCVARSAAIGAADKTIRWIVLSDERPERKRRAGEARRQVLSTGAARAENR